MEKDSQNINWLLELKQKVPQFMEELKGEKKSGFYHYSLSGDLYSEDENWGLGNTVFAIKIYYTLNLLNSMVEEEKNDMAQFIKNFQDEQGNIYDPLVKHKSFVREKLSAIRHRRFNNFFHRQTMRAETRQAVSALHLLGGKPKVYPKEMPDTKRGAEKYLSSLKWEVPWGAGSHFSHLLFFLANSEKENKDELIDYAIWWVNKLQNPETGSWYRGNPSLQNKINGAMKVLTGLKAADRMEFKYAKQLVDLCLSAKNDKHACDNFNIVYVLKYANEALDGQYRNTEIRDFARERLNIYQEYYWPEHGGFSFHKGRANDYYYKAIITKGLPEPDIHGTVMFLWGVALIAQILNIEENLGFQEFVT